MNYTPTTGPLVGNHLSYSQHSARRRRMTQVTRAKLALLFIPLLIGIAGAAIAASHSSPISAQVTKVTSAAKSKINAVSQPGGSTPSSTSSSVVLGSQTTKSQPVRATAPICSTGQLATAVAPQISPSQPGLHQSPTLISRYTIYGNTSGQIGNQMNDCSPVIIGNQRFAASTDYSITWSYTVTVNAIGQCNVSQASVGLGIAQTFPAWQATQPSEAGLDNTWQTFLTNLTTHENGHAQLDQSYANRILADLQNMPATDCDSINTAANDKANTEINALDKANADYDAQTNHGVTQGAILAVR